MRRGLLDPLFRYIGSASHEASSLAFRRRQQQRQREAQAAAAEQASKVAPIKRRQTGRFTVDSLIVVECCAFALIALAAMWLGYI